MGKLRVRLLYATRIFRWLLFLIGIPDTEVSVNWHRLKRFWKVFNYLIALQAHIYIFVERSYHYLDFSMIVNLDALMAIVGRLNRLVGNMLLHTFLAFNLENIFMSFSQELENAYLFLNRPSLVSITVFAIVGSLWIFWAVREIPVCD